MQSSPDAILDWLHKEMGYRPLGPYIASTKASMPSSDAIRRVCRGNMLPVWNFLLTRVKSEKTVDSIRRNILVHGEKDTLAAGAGGAVAGSDGSRRSRGGRKKEKVTGDNNNSNSNNNNNSNNVNNNIIINNSREVALQERDMAEKEVERLRHMVRRQRKELKARMMEVSREEAERKRMLDERSNYRFR